MRKTTAMAGIAACGAWRKCRGLLACIAVQALTLTSNTVAGAEIDISAAGSVAFGSLVRVLPNGNIVVTDPNGPTANIGTVYLYTPTGTKISSFTGSSPNDHVGSGGIAVLPNGNFVVVSPQWTNGTLANAGAVTWVNGSTGLNGVVSAANSLVGSSAGDQVGYVADPELPPLDSVADYGIAVLDNGNYLVFSPNWHNGSVAQAGAVTFGNGASGIAGAVSAANSLVGSHAGDQIGCGGYSGSGDFCFYPLSNGNVVLTSPFWSSALASQVGAVTWISGTQGLTGALSASNSLIGLTANDQVGSGGVTALTNGNYVVGSPTWSNGAVANAGAATWGDGTVPTSGVVSPANSLVGSTAGDAVGQVVFALSNGNYVVTTSTWSNGANANTGAATWGNGSTGVTGTISAANSLIGSSSNDKIGEVGAFALTNGNYVVGSPDWNNGGVQSAGAVTWGDGSLGVHGVVSAANSLVGSTAFDQVGNYGVYALSNGNYVLPSPSWSNGSVSAVGAVTWADGSLGISGPVTSSNSLVGTSANDRAGADGLYLLSNGNYVVSSPYWSNAGAANAGAATWANGSTGIRGAISAANSLVGTQPSDYASLVVVPLTNGNYVVTSPNWANGSAAKAGAVSWANGTTGISGAISAANSLLGTSAGDGVGSITRALANGSFIAASPHWSNAATGATQVGAVTWGSGTAPITGQVSPLNSLVGATSNDSIAAPTMDTGTDGSTFDVTAVSTRPDADYLIFSAQWSNGAATAAGAITLGSGRFRLSGTIQAWNSVRGTSANQGLGVLSPHDYDPTRHQLVVGRPQQNLVSLFTMDQIFADRFE